MKNFLLLLVMSLLLNVAHAQWQSVAGQAHDVGVGANGTVWVIGWVAVPGGYNIARWNGSSWENIPGGAVRIDVDPNGNAWIVNDAGLIFRWNGRSWDSIGGQAHDVGIGANGTVWVIGWTAVPGGFNIGRWNGSYWEDIPGGAVRIDVDPSGNAWITNDAGLIFRWNGREWDSSIGGQAHDVGIGADGRVWVIGWRAVPGGYNIGRWTGSYWEEIPGGLNNISGAPNGVAWATNTDGVIWRWKNTVVLTTTESRFQTETQIKVCISGAPPNSVIFLEATNVPITEVQRIQITTNGNGEGCRNLIYPLTRSWCLLTNAFRNTLGEIVARDANGQIIARKNFRIDNLFRRENNCPNALSITVKTGQDDLRGGSSRAFITFHFTNSSSAEFPLSNGEGWPENSFHDKSFDIGTHNPDELVGITIRHDGTPNNNIFNGGNIGDTYDNWNIDKIKVDFNYGAVLMELNGSPLVRFKGDLRSKRFNR